MRLLRRMALFPLLRKDLMELAQRRRTYVLRVLYAVVLFGCFLMFFGATLSRSGRAATSVLGSGREVFDFLVAAQFVGIFVFLPAMMSGALTYEKERRSMALLLLTDLRPGEILLEKYLGRLVPMFAFLLLALPLLAIAYAYGGVPTNLLWASVYMLAVACLQVGALALMCSAFCTSGAVAFIASYVLGFLLYFGLLLPMGALSAMDMVDYVDEDVVFAFCPPYVLFEAYGRGMTSVVGRSIPALISIVLFLVMARVFLVRRAFAVPGHLLRRIFRRMDRFWNKANRLTGGIVLLKERDTLPGDEPIVWREVRTRALARFSNLFRILCAVEIPVLLIGAVCVTGGSRSGDAEELSVVLFVIWPIAALALAVAAGNTFASERVGQTLEVLLTTPLSGAEIVRQKVRALRRFMMVLAAPLVTIYAVEYLVEADAAQLEVAAYLVASLLSIVVYFPLIVWLSVWIGLRLRSRAMAAVVPVAVIFVWCALPVFLLACAQELFSWRIFDVPTSYLFLTSPASMVVLPEFSYEFSDFFDNAPLLAIVLNYAFYGAAALFFRWLCLRNADSYLGRAPAPEGEESYAAE